VDVGVVCILHRLFVWPCGKDRVEFVGGFEACASADRTAMLVWWVGAMVVVILRWVPVKPLGPGKVLLVLLAYVTLVSAYYTCI
jgi:hypothetical protein